MKQRAAGFLFRQYTFRADKRACKAEGKRNRPGMIFRFSAGGKAL